MQLPIKETQLELIGRYKVLAMSLTQDQIDAVQYVLGGVPGGGKYSWTSDKLVSEYNKTIRRITETGLANMS